MFGDNKKKDKPDGSVVKVRNLKDLEQNVDKEQVRYVLPNYFK